MLYLNQVSWNVDHFQMSMGWGEGKKSFRSSQFLKNITVIYIFITVILVSICMYTAPFHQKVVSHMYA